MGCPSQRPAGQFVVRWPELTECGACESLDVARPGRVVSLIEPFGRPRMSVLDDIVAGVREDLAEEGGVRGHGAGAQRAFGGKQRSAAEAPIAAHHQHAAEHALVRRA